MLACALVVAAAVLGVWMMVRRAGGQGPEAEESARSQMHREQARGDEGASADEGALVTPDDPATVDTAPEAPDGSQVVVSHLESEPVPEAARAALAAYRDEGTCVLAHAGYLDLLGMVWGCVVQGDGWVDICTVSQTGDPGVSRVGVTHLMVGDVLRELGKGGLSDE